MKKRRRPQGGYITITRGMMEHPLLDRPRSFSHYETWEWLLIHAAWRPSGERRRNAVVHLERGQLAATIRELAAAWTWSRGAVERWLAELEGEEMISLATVVGTRKWELSKRLTSYRVSLITICNYNKYQRASARVSKLQSQESSPVASQESLQFTAPVADSGAQPEQTTRTKESKSPRSKPFDGARGGPGRRMVWFDHGTDDWNRYAKDYRDVMDAEILPQSRNGGRGNWFHYLGQATAKKRA